jgi:signal transduction histidine kinase
MRWRGAALNIALAAAGVGIDMLTTWKAWGTPGSPAATGVLLSLLAGLPLAFVCRRPLPVALFLAGYLVYTDQAGVPTANTVQMLLILSIGAVAHTTRLGPTLAVAAVGAAATAVNLADPGLAFTRNAWYYSVAAALLPVVIGCYLKGPAGRLRERDLTPDVLLGGGGLAVAVLGTWPDWHSGAQPVWVNGMGVVLAGLSLGVVRRLPGLVFMLQTCLLLAAHQYFPEGLAAAQILCLIAAGVFAMRVASWVWTALVYLLAAGLATVAVVDEQTEITPLRVVVLMVLVATPIIIGRHLRVRQLAAESERSRVREAERLALAQLRADQLAERERIAREVHDIVAHHVGAMVLRAGAARYAAPSGPVAEALADIHSTGHQTLQDLRGLLEVLRDPGVRPDLLADPADVVKDSTERMTAAGLLVLLDLDPAADQAPLVARASAARIIQEGLTNVLKHAGPGTRVHVSVTAAPAALTVEVRNDNPPTARERLPSSGQGLTGMRERARALGGTLTAGPAADGGWRLTALLPFPKAQVEA